MPSAMRLGPALRIRRACSICVPATGLLPESLVISISTPTAAALGSRVV